VDLVLAVSDVLPLVPLPQTINPGNGYVEISMLCLKFIKGDRGTKCFQICQRMSARHFNTSWTLLLLMWREGKHLCKKAKSLEPATHVTVWHGEYTVPIFFPEALEGTPHLVFVQLITPT